MEESISSFPKHMEVMEKWFNLYSEVNQGEKMDENNVSTYVLDENKLW